MTLVPAGPYLAGEQNRVDTLSAYYIDIHPVTNADYAQFVQATGHRVPLHWQDGQFSADTADHPVVFVDHTDASTYARWAGKALPSSEQWEKAARGDQGDLYPWGNQASVVKCNVRESGLRCTTPVNRYHSGASQYGVYDMCGNVWEWCRTESTTGRFVLKGSAFTSSITRAAPAAMNDASASMMDDDTGFRCVLAVD